MSRAADFENVLQRERAYDLCYSEGVFELMLLADNAELAKLALVYPVEAAMLAAYRKSGVPIHKGLPSFDELYCKAFVCACTPAEWPAVNPDAVCMVWKAKCECAASDLVYQPISEIETTGTPICPECDKEYEYVNTVVDVTKSLVLK